MAPTTRSISRSQAADASADRLLWAPWRYTYLQRASRRRRKCIFCFGKLNEAARRQRLVLFENRDVFAILNRYPYINGHLMVAPRRHVASPELLSRDERAMIQDLIAASVKALRDAMHPAGFNLGANLGRASGAGFVDHMHWHVVPRWDGDNNFMPVLASTRVLSQSLEDSFRNLRPVFKMLGAALTLNSASSRGTRNG